MSVRVTLIHGGFAGQEDHTQEQLVDALGEAGYETRYQRVLGEEWERALDDPGDFVVAAGGDGTASLVASRLIGRGIPLAIVPLGTANNIAQTLGIRGPAMEVLEALPSFEAARFDCGTIAGLGQTRRFFEGAGIGFVPRTMPAIAASLCGEEFPLPGERLDRHRQAMAAAIDVCPAVPVHARLDGKDISGSYVMIEIMNVAAIGPHLTLAPQALPGDGLFDVLLVTDDMKKPLAEYLMKTEEGSDAGVLPACRRASIVEIDWDGSPFHIDGRVVSASASVFASVEQVGCQLPTVLEIKIEPAALTVLAPPAGG